jgi:uncharacterized protein YndB with AHSA1/START domain
MPRYVGPAEKPVLRRRTSMSPIVSTIDIARPPDAVYGYVTDPSRFPEWQPDVVSVRVDGPRFTTTRRIGGTERTMTQEITEDSPPRRWSARGVDGPIRPHATVAVEPTNSGASSRVTFTLDFYGHGIGKPLVPLVFRQARKGAEVSYRNLKERLEADVRRDPPAR